MKQSLSPIAVPWMVSPSGPFLELTLFESEANATLSFAADFGPVRVESPDWVVKLHFTACIECRWTLSWSPDAYDWSLMPVNFKTAADTEEYVRQCDKYWKQHGIAPDPGFYEVLESEWLSQIHKSAKGGQWRHFVVSGHDADVEIVAEGWTWEEEAEILNPNR